jgi:hypothetical protein
VSQHFDDLDAVLEFDALEEFGQLIFVLQSSPCFCSGVDKFQHLTLAVFGDRAPFVLTVLCDSRFKPLSIILDILLVDEIFGCIFHCASPGDEWQTTHHAFLWGASRGGRLHASRPR